MKASGRAHHQVWKQMRKTWTFRRRLDTSALRPVHVPGLFIIFWAWASYSWIMSNADQMRGTGWWLEKERISPGWECHKGERNINQQGRDSFFPPSHPCSSRFCLVLTSLEFWHGPIVTKESHPKYFLALMSKINTVPMVWPLFRISFTFIRSWEFVLPFWSYLQLLDPSHSGPRGREWGSSISELTKQERHYLAFSISSKCVFCRGS